MDPIIEVASLTKRYANGFTALDGVDLTIARGEVLALLGPNGAGKTTLISVICGLVTPTSGSVRVAGYDIVADYRKTRALIGLVPQELTTDAFETVWNTVSFSRGLFGLPRNPDHIEQVLRDLSLWDKKDNMIMQLSGGMKRRVLIAKALSHEPKILFLDEPTAGVDVELRQGMWRTVRRLNDAGVTIILTTHYIEEAEEIADRVAIIDKGAIAVVDDKQSLMRRMGRKRLSVELTEPVERAPDAVAAFDVALSADGRTLSLDYDSHAAPDAAADVMRALIEAGVRFRDLQTDQSSLEEIFVELTKADA